MFFQYCQSLCYHGSPALPLRILLIRPGNSEPGPRDIQSEFNLDEGSIVIRIQMQSVRCCE